MAAWSAMRLAAVWRRSDAYRIHTSCFEAGLIADGSDGSPPPLVEAGARELDSFAGSKGDV